MRILREPLFGAKRYSAFSVVTFERLCRNYIKQRRFAAVKGTERPFLRQNEWYRGNFRLILLYEAFLFCNLCFYRRINNEQGACKKIRSEKC